MSGEFEPIEREIKDTLTKVAEDVGKGYPEHLKEISERAERIVADGTKRVDEGNAAEIKKILDDLDAHSSRTDVTSGAKTAEQSKLTARLRSILDPSGEAQRTSELNNHINALRTEGHAPGRHLDPDDQALKDRLGT